MASQLPTTPSQNWQLPIKKITYVNSNQPSQYKNCPTPFYLTTVAVANLKSCYLSKKIIPMAVTTTKKITQDLSKLKVRLKEKYPIASIALFGSYARNEQTPLSDVDILIEFNGRMGSNFVDLANEIENALGIKVDLISKKGLKERYLKAIEPELIYV